MTSLVGFSGANASLTQCTPVELLLIDPDRVGRQRFIDCCKDAFETVSVRGADQLQGALAMISARVPDIIFVALTPDNSPSPADCIGSIRSVARDDHLPIIALCKEYDRQRLETLNRCGVTDALAIADLSTAAMYRCISHALEKSKLQRDNATKDVVIQQNNRELAIQKQHIGSFYEAVSHELKSPLAGAREYVSLVLDGVCGEASPSQKELLTHAIECCDSLRDLIHDLLDTAAMENGMLVLRNKPCDLEQLVRNVVARHSAVARRQGISIDIDIQGRPRSICCDEFRISQLLSHLLSNAIKHSCASGDIRVTLNTTDKTFVSLSVADSGPGIEQAHRQRVFDKFYQIKQANEDEFEHHEGMGVGLFLCRSIACLHGGKLTLQSTPGEGCVFTAQIPNNHGP